MKRFLFVFNILFVFFLASGIKGQTMKGLNAKPANMPVYNLSSSSKSLRGIDDAIIYPNPARDYIIIKSQNGFYLTHISIFSIVGNIVLERKIDSRIREFHANISKFTPGRYFVKINYSNGKQEVIQMIKI